MDSLSTIIEIFAVAVSAAVFGGIALLIAFEAKAHRPTKNRSAANSSIGVSVNQIDLRVAQPANAGNAGNISKAA